MAVVAWVQAGVRRRRVLTHAHSTATAAQVWDVRKLAEGGGRKPAPVVALAHPKSSQGAVWAPDGSGRLLSVSFDDTLRVWGPPTGAGAGAAGVRQMAQRLSVRHDNQTGR